MDARKRCLKRRKKKLINRIRKIAILAFGLMLIISIVVTFVNIFGKKKQQIKGDVVTLIHKSTDKIRFEPLNNVTYAKESEKVDSSPIPKEVNTITSNDVNVSKYVTSRVNLRAKPNTESKVLMIIGFGVKLNVDKQSGEWCEVKYKGKCGFVKSEYLSDEKPQCKSYDISDKGTSNFKSYMSYEAITSRTSRQWKLQSEMAYNDGTYGIRMINERYCVAIGTYFNSEVGDYADLVLANGTVIECVISDIKDDRDTDANNIITTVNGCATEFIVDTNSLNIDAKLSGNVSMCNPELWNSRVVEIIIYDENVLEVDE